MSEVLSTFRLRTGDPMPGFSLPDAEGRAMSGDEVRGSAGLLVAINSNDVENYPQDSADLMKPFATEHRWEFPYLIDESQEAAQAFGAACTPDFFLFDGEGRLFYTGQFDDSRPRSDREPHGGDLREAARLMRGGQEPLARPYPSSGCNIKWKPGNQPTWWNAGG